MKNKIVKNFEENSSKLKIKFSYFIPIIGMITCLTFLQKIYFEWINLKKEELDIINKKQLRQSFNSLDNNQNVLESEYVKINMDRSIVIQMFQKIFMKNYFRYFKITLFIFFPFVFMLFPWTFYLLVTKRSVKQMLIQLKEVG